MRCIWLADLLVVRAAWRVSCAAVIQYWASINGVGVCYCVGCEVKDVCAFIEEPVVLYSCDVVACDVVAVDVVIAYACLFD